MLCSLQLRWRTARAVILCSRGYLRMQLACFSFRASGWIGDAHAVCVRSSCSKLPRTCTLFEARGFQGRFHTQWSRQLFQVSGLHEFGRAILRGRAILCGRAITLKCPENSGARSMRWRRAPSPREASRIFAKCCGTVSKLRSYVVAPRHDHPRRLYTKTSRSLAGTVRKLRGSLGSQTSPSQHSALGIAIPALCTRLTDDAPSVRGQRCVTARLRTH